MKEKDLLVQRERRRRQNNNVTKKYEKTKKGFLMRLYRNMKSRIEGIQKVKIHLYLDKDILDKQEFYKWSLNNPAFHELFDKYEKSGFERKLSPSVDRINPDKGYSLDNMEFITMSENSSRGGYGAMKKRYGYIKQ